jgi:NTE family protein
MEIYLCEIQLQQTFAEYHPYLKTRSSNITIFRCIIIIFACNYLFKFMKKYIVVPLFILLSCLHTQSQTVGLVLSGGGAKGIAHIGLIKALEENEIPIDYVAGTSMGAIVGGWYAIGLSPDEMISLIKSEEFKSWQSGKVDEREKFFYKKDDPTPEFAHFKVDLNDTSKTKASFFPISLVNPIQMNLGFMKIFSRAGAYSQGDFNKLMVPFRCVSSDVYNKRAVVLRRGDLGNSVRASMTIPFVFKPIRVEGNLMYDGGIYNNFPTDVMTEDFNPDIMIGSAVVQNPLKPDENDLFGQMENMVMQKTDYSISPNKGINVVFDMSKVDLLDFDNVDYVYELGYKEGLKIISALRERIKRRAPAESVALRRSVFKSHLPDLIFYRVTVTGVTGSQEQYILRQIKRNQKGEITFENFRRAYFRLLSDKKIEEISPTAQFNPETGYFDLNLNVKLNESLQVSLGGLITSATANQAYLGMKYQTLRFYSLDLNADTYLGDAYNSLQVSGRIEIPTVLPIYMKVSGVTTSKSYFQSKRLFYTQSAAAYLKQAESFGRVSFGTPYKTTGRATLSFSYGRLTDEYSTTAIGTTDIKLDKSQYYLNGAALHLKKNTLNSIMYPNEGTEAMFSTQIFSGSEKYYSNGTAGYNLDYEAKHIWGQSELVLKKYFSKKKGFALGTLVDVVASNKPFFRNYASTLLQAPAFTPTPHSKIEFNESLRAMNFVACGIMPLWVAKSGIQIRSEFYGFLPYQAIASDADRKPVLQKTGKGFQYFGEMSLVYNSPVTSIAIYGNRYSFPKNNWNWGINIGFYLQNSKFIE